MNVVAGTAVPVPALMNSAGAVTPPNMATRMNIILLYAPAGTDGPVIWLIRVKVVPPGVTVSAAACGSG